MAERGGTSVVSKVLNVVLATLNLRGLWNPQGDVHACVLSHVQLCGPVDSGLPAFSVHGILQARILEWVAISSSRGSPQSRDQT